MGCLHVLLQLLVLSSYDSECSLWVLNQADLQYYLREGRRGVGGGDRKSVV